MATYFNGLIILSICIIIGINANSQSKPLTIGQSVPDISSTMINYSKPTIKVSDFRGKLLILDFWATWCQPCRAFLKTADELQRSFDGKVEILPVTYEDRTKIEQFVREVKENTGLQIASVVNDTIFQ